MAGTKVSSRKLRKSVKSRRRQRGGLPNFLSMFEGRKAGEGNEDDVPGASVTSPEEEPVRVVGSPDHGEGFNNTGSNPPAQEEGGFMKKLGFGGRRSRRASRRVRRRNVRRTARRVRRRSRRRSNRRK